MSKCETIPSEDLDATIDHLNEAFGCTPISKASKKAVAQCPNGELAEFYEQGLDPGKTKLESFEVSKAVLSAIWACVDGDAPIVRPDGTASISVGGEVTQFVSPYLEIDRPVDSVDFACIEFTGKLEGALELEVVKKLSKLFPALSELRPDIAIMRLRADPNYSLIVTVKGGFYEGAGQIRMMCRAAVGENNNNFSQLPDGQELKDRMKEGLPLVNKISGLNIFPDMVIDALVMAGINPYILNEEGQLGLRKDVVDFVESIGEDIFVRSSEMVKLTSAELFYEIAGKICSAGFWEEDEPQDRLNSRMAAYYDTVSAHTQGLHAVGARFEACNAERTSLNSIQREISAYDTDCKAQLEAIYRTRGVIGIMIALYYSSDVTSYKETIGCPARYTDVMKAWYEYNVAFFTGWYDHEYERLGLEDAS